MCGLPSELLHPSGGLDPISQPLSNLKRAHLFIYRRWVLTAAHCLPSGEQTSKVWVYIGNIYSHINKRKRTEKIKAKAFFIHPNYAGTGFKGNLPFPDINSLYFCSWFNFYDFALECIETAIHVLYNSCLFFQNVTLSIQLK